MWCCEEENAEDARFCCCGALREATEVRKTSRSFCEWWVDLLAEELDAETWGQVMVRYFEAMRTAWSATGVRSRSSSGTL